MTAAVALPTLAEARTRREPARQPVWCPTCGATLAGLLTECREPGCLSRYLDDDAAYARSLDV